MRTGVHRVVVAFGLFGLFGCGTSAQGISECRTIELARCDAAAACGFPNVQECRTYLRDHCLRGLAADEVPPAQVIEDCRAAVEAAGACASREGEQVRAADCMESLAPVDPEATACEIVLQPERASACEFLTAPRPDSDQD